MSSLSTTTLCGESPGASMLSFVCVWHLNISNARAQATLIGIRARASRHEMTARDVSAIKLDRSQHRARIEIASIYYSNRAVLNVLDTVWPASLGLCVDDAVSI